MKKLLTAVLMTAAFGAAGALAADGAAKAAEAAPAKGGACSADAGRFCKDIKPGGGRVKACLEEHKKELSEACSQRLERRGGRKGRAAWSGRGGGRGGGGNFACAPAYERGFSRGFGRGQRMAARGGRGGARAGLRRGARACAADARELCRDVKPGEGRVQACLRENLGKLSGGCKARQERLLEKGKKTEGKAAGKKA